MKKVLVLLPLIVTFCVSACNIPLSSPLNGMTQEEAISATMTAWLENIDANATASAENNNAIETNIETGGGNQDTILLDPLVLNDIPWCPAVGYMTLHSQNQVIIYWPISSSGQDQIIFEGFTGPIYQGEAIVPIDEDQNPNTFSLVYYSATHDAIFKWANMESQEIVRDKLNRSHLIMAPASPKMAFSEVDEEGSRVYVSTSYSASFAQPLLKSSRTDLSLDPIRMLLDDAGNLIGLYVRYVDDKEEEGYRTGQSLIYIDMMSGEANTLLDESWKVLDVSQTGKLAVVSDAESGNALSLYSVNRQEIVGIPLCDDCINPGAALIRPDDGLVAWTEKIVDSSEEILRVADSAGNIIFELDSSKVAELAGFPVGMMQAKGWLTSGILLVDCGGDQNHVIALNIVTGLIEWKSEGNFLSLVFDPELCK